MSNWGGANRPITSNKLGSPNPREGSDGDMQVRQTNLGAKIFAKVGGRWHESPLSREGVTKIGANISDYLSIDSDSVDVFKNDAKVASFGETLVIGKVADDSSRLEVDSSGNIKIINRQGTTDSTKVAIDNDGSATFTGNIVVGGTTVTSLANGATANSTDAHLLALTNATGTLAAGNTQNLENLNGAITAGQVNCTNIGLGGKIILTSDGDRNICIGIDNGDAGDDNIAIGSKSGKALHPNSNRNVLIGTNAGLVVGDGANDNICIGNNAGYDITNGDLNICIGTQAGFDITTAQANICIGYQSGFALTATVDSGGGAPPARNTLLGNKAGATITTGYQNTCVGALADVTGTGAENQIAIGTTTTCPANNSAVIGNANITNVYMSQDGGATVNAGKMAIGLGTNAPTFTFELKGDPNDIVMYAENNDTSGNVYIAKWKLSGTNPNDTTSYFLSCEDSVNRLRIYSNGDVYTTTGTNIQALSSDERMKTSIQDYTGGLAIVNSLKPRTYEWKPGRGETGIKYGFISQEIQAISDVKPEMNLYSKRTIEADDKDIDLCPDGIINTTQLSAKDTILISAIQELSAKIDTMQIEINNLKG